MLLATKRFLEESEDGAFPVPRPRPHHATSPPGAHPPDTSAADGYNHILLQSEGVSDLHLAAGRVFGQAVEFDDAKCFSLLSKDAQSS